MLFHEPVSLVVTLLAEIRPLTERRAIARARLGTRLICPRRAIDRMPKLHCDAAFKLKTVHLQKELIILLLVIKIVQ